MPDVYTDNMSRNATEAERLNDQLKLLNQNIGYLLHPEITAKLPSSPRIADIATGTGAFLMELANEHPEATLRGYDISQDLFPSSENLGSNIKLGIMDAKKPPPLEEQNLYDVVHVRLLIAAMNPEDWEVVTRNLVQMLKPGGAIQWDECNFGQSRAYRGKTSSTLSGVKPAIEAMQNGIKEKFAYGWNTLPQAMRNAGLIHVEQDIVSSDRIPETRKAVTENGIAVVFGWANLMADRGAPGAIPTQELARLEEQAYNDLKSGCYIRYDVHVTTGFKPE